MDEKVKFIKTVILDILAQDGIEANQIMLFGSKAARTDTKYSDYDLLVVIRQKVAVQTKIILSTRIRKSLAESLIDADIIIKSGEELEQYRDEIGTVTREALSEGVVI